MKCREAKRLFGAYWDDDTTQAEREWLEAHFTSCSSCRAAYEEFSGVLELVSTLPRAEAAPNFAERTLARARRAVSAPDRIPATVVPWVPVTAAAALLIVAATLVSSWLDLGIGPRIRARAPESIVVRQPEAVQPLLTSLPEPAGATRTESRTAPSAVAIGSDSLFDHTEDVEFILDPITLRRGSATVTRQPAGTEGRPAVISF
jgi:anti-sigma factor RsiW